MGSGGGGRYLGPSWWAKIIKWTEHFHYFYITLETFMGVGQRAGPGTNPRISRVR